MIVVLGGTLTRNLWVLPADRIDETSAEPTVKKEPQSDACPGGKFWWNAFSGGGLEQVSPGGWIRHLQARGAVFVTWCVAWFLIVGRCNRRGRSERHAGSRP
jgi:hypothetical protein